ncbi:MAG: hypothetical protein Roseis2KO_09540 [Roseivirga sp.]
MFWVYILYSKTAGRHYTGYSIDPDERLKEHNEGYCKGSYSSAVRDWELRFMLKCQSKKQALQIERHIKRMKSRVYIQNLIKYPEMGEKLLIKYK